MEREKIRTVALWLADSDMTYICMPLLESVYQALKFHSFMMRKDHLETMIRLSYKPYFYGFFVKHYDQNENGHADSVVAYLNESVSILFNREAEDKILSGLGDGHGSWYLECETGKIYSF